MEESTKPEPYKVYPVDDITGWLDEPPLVVAEEPIPEVVVASVFFGCRNCQQTLERKLGTYRVTCRACGHLHIFTSKFEDESDMPKQTKPTEPADTSVTFRNITEILNRFDDLPGSFSTYYRSIVDPESLYISVSELRHRSSLPSHFTNAIGGDKLRKVVAEMVMELDRLMQANGSDLGDVVSAHVYGISQMAAEDLQKFLSLPGADAAIDRMIQAREERRRMKEREKGID